MLMGRMLCLPEGGPGCRKVRGTSRGRGQVHFTVSDRAPDRYHRGVPGCSGRTHRAETVIE